MKRFIYIVMVLVMICSIAGCGARIKRIANDINWVVFDGEPSRDN